MSPLSGLWSFLFFMLTAVSMFSQNKFLFDSATIDLRPLNVNTKESEFSPFIIGNTFYYTSSKERKVGVTHMEKATERQMLDIYKGKLSDSVTVKDIKVLTRKINNSVNQGTCFFDIETSRLYYSGDVPTQSHYKKYKLAIFSSEFKNNEFQYPKIELVLADTFSAAHPMLYKGRLYFSANLIGGKGKTDIYYAEKLDNQWVNIKNCAFLNTPECEYFPYVINNEEIYFSSNRPGGYGKLDIYKCTTVDSTYLIQNLGSPVNTKYDDFGVYIDSLQEGGYFSSDRKKAQDDIYFFKQTWPVFKNCKEPIKEDYCYNLTEESTLDSDSLKGYYYQWSFGDGTTEKGLNVRHCFPGPASYLINLNIIDSVTRAVFMSQASFDLKVDSIVQLKINCLDTVLQNKKFNINTDWTYLPNNKINGYYFEVDGRRMRGKSHDEVFADKGRHKVLLGVATYNTLTKQKELLCTTKEIVCVDSATWLAVEKRQIQKIAEQFAFKKFPGDSALLTNMNYNDEEMKFNKKGLNGALAAAEIKKIVDEKIANKTNRSDTVNNDIAAKNKTNDQNNTATTNNKNETDSAYNGIVGSKYIKPVMDTLMNIKEEEDVSFKVNLGSSKTAKDTTLLNAKGITGIKEQKVGDEYQYTYGNEKKIKDIEKYYDKTIKAGIEDAVVVAYKNDSIIGTQKKNTKGVDFDKVKTKEDSLRIAKNIEGKNAVQNNTNNLNAIQLRVKANTLIAEAVDKDLKAGVIKNDAATKSGTEKDSLVAIASMLETKAQDQKLQAANLLQKANMLDYQNNSVTIKEQLTKLKKTKPVLANEFIAKNTEISAQKTEAEKLKKEANEMSNTLEKIAALNVVEQKEAAILLKQDQLISQLKEANANNTIVSNSKNNTNSNQENNINVVNNTKNNVSNSNNSLNNKNENGSDNPTVKNNSSNTNQSNSKNTTNTNSNSKNKNTTSSNEDDFDEYGFIPTTDIQKTNMEFLEDFGDIEVEDLEFKVQVGVFKKRTTYHFPKLKGLGKVANERLKDGSTRMTMGGSYRTLRQAFRHNKRIVKAGQKDAFVSVYYKGKRIGIENLKRKGVLVKTQVVTDTVSETKLTINSSNLTEYAEMETNEIPDYNPTEKDPVKSEATLPIAANETESEENFVFAPRTNIQKKTMFYAEKYGNIAADGLEFKVQIAIFKYRSSYSFPKLKNLGKIETEIADEGGTRMTIGGAFKTLNEAFEFNKKVVKAGQTDAFVSVFYQGKRIYIENLERKGIFTTK
ncbi:MAG: PKD domain-containing protein [Bacteroidetes bacterium]|nr:PKD domain-containing protein [Bacteroidota bacterium]